MANHNFSTIEELRVYNLQWVKNSAIEAFTNLRLQTLNDGIISFLGEGGGGGGGGVTPDLVQIHTAGSSATVSSGVNILLINPSSNILSLSVTLPSVPHSSNEVTLFFGGTMTTGEVVGTLTINAPAGTTKLQATAPFELQAGESVIFHKVNTVWRRKY